MLERTRTWGRSQGSKLDLVLKSEVDRVKDTIFLFTVHNVSGSVLTLSSFATGLHSIFHTYPPATITSEVVCFGGGSHTGVATEAGARIVYTQGEGKSKTELVLEWLGPVSRTFKYSCAKGFSVQMDVTEYTLEIHCVLAEVSLRSQRWTLMNPEINSVTYLDHQIVMQDIEDRIKTQEREVAEIHERLLDLSEEDELPVLMKDLGDCTSKLKVLGEKKATVQKDLDKIANMESAFYNHLSSNEMKTFLVFVKKGYKGDAEKNILSLSAGQVIRVLDSTHQCWWFGSLLGTSLVGFFPAHVVYGGEVRLVSKDSPEALAFEQECKTLEESVKPSATTPEREPRSRIHRTKSEWQRPSLERSRDRSCSRDSSNEDFPKIVMRKTREAVDDKSEKKSEDKPDTNGESPILPLPRAKSSEKRKCIPEIPTRLQHKTQLCRVNNHFITTEPSEMSLVKGEIISLDFFAADAEWWEGRKISADGGAQHGWFPKIYVDLLTLSDTLTTTEKSALCKNRKAIAIASFMPKDSNELELVEGHEITVVDPTIKDSDWWEGFSQETNKFGYFPKCYVKLKPQTTPNYFNFFKDDSEVSEKVTSLSRSLSLAKSEEFSSSKKLPIISSGSASVRHSRRKTRSKSAMDSGISITSVFTRSAPIEEEKPSKDKDNYRKKYKESKEQIKELKKGKQDLAQQRLTVTENEQLRALLARYEKEKGALSDASAPTPTTSSPEKNSGGGDRGSKALPIPVIDMTAPESSSSHTVVECGSEEQGGNKQHLMQKQFYSSFVNNKNVTQINLK